ncbi:MAG: DUF58 domain-containing protein [Oscillospiraceae bacterium]|nr:DUF58 domain-containing protein [Oscillospiraceae bacterium]
MIKSKIVYLVLLASMVLFYILFIDSMSLLTLIITVIFPFLQLALLSHVSRKITASMDIETRTVPRNTDTRIIVKIKNHSLLPVSCAMATVSIKNTLTDECQTLTTLLPVSSDNEQSIKFSVSYAHCGKVKVTLKNLKIYDYIKLFSKTINLNISQEIAVVPSLVNISPSIEVNLSGISESDEFSKNKPGDDCTEIFNIREYVYGDKLNRIHWNLSTKLDELMVKEYSLPVSSQVIILFEFCTDENSEDRFSKNDAAIETAMSLSHYMIKNGVSHRICWFDPELKCLRNEKITSADDFSGFMGAIFTSGTYRNSFSAFIHHKFENSDAHFSHTLYISPVLSDEVFHNLSVLNNTYKKSYIYINDCKSELPEFFRSSDSIYAVPADCGNISGELNRMII